MVPDWFVICAAVTAFSLTGFAVVAALWLRRLRESVSAALTESANQQIRTAQRLSDAMDTIQKQQRQHEQQVHTLAQAGLRLRQELVNVSNRLDHSQQADTPSRSDQTIH